MSMKVCGMNERFASLASPRMDGIKSSSQVLLKTTVNDDMNFVPTQILIEETQGRAGDSELLRSSQAIEMLLFFRPRFRKQGSDSCLKGLSFVRQCCLAVKAMK